MQSFLGVLFWNNIIIFQFNGGLEYIKRKGLVTGSNPMCCCYLKQRNIFIFHFKGCYLNPTAVKIYSLVLPLNLLHLVQDIYQLLSSSAGYRYLSLIF